MDSSNFLWCALEFSNNNSNLVLFDFTIEEILWKLADYGSDDVEDCSVDLKFKLKSKKIEKVYLWCILNETEKIVNGAGNDIIGARFW